MSEVNERTPLNQGSSLKEFYFTDRKYSHHGEVVSNSGALSSTPVQSSWFSFFRPSQIPSSAPVSSKPRKLPVKVEPKVFFANERTFLSWLSMSVTLASISLAILAFADANEWSAAYGLALLPCAAGFCAYALWLFIRRSKMLRERHPGPYEDRIGPAVLASMLGLAIFVNFIVKLFDLAQ